MPAVEVSGAEMSAEVLPPARLSDVSADSISAATANGTSLSLFSSVFFTAAVWLK